MYWDLTLRMAAACPYAAHNDGQRAAMQMKKAAGTNSEKSQPRRSVSKLRFV
jgi:hypothetical protein